MIDEEGALYQEVRRCEGVVGKRKRAGKEPSPEAEKALADARAALRAWRSTNGLLDPAGRRIPGVEAPTQKRAPKTVPLRDLNAAIVAAATARGPRLGGKIV